MSGQNTVDKLALGIREHNAGNLQAAEAHYRDILVSDAQHPDALHLLGVVLHQYNRNQEAVDFILRAIELNPESADAYNNLGNALDSQGKPNEAVASYKAAQ